MIRFICDKCGGEFPEVDMVRLNANHYVPSCGEKVNILTTEVCCHCFTELGKSIMKYVKEKSNGDAG